MKATSTCRRRKVIQHQGLRPLEAGKHSLHARAGAAPARHWGHGQLPASRRRRDTFRPFERGIIQPLLKAVQIFRFHRKRAPRPSSIWLLRLMSRMSAANISTRTRSPKPRPPRATRPSRLDCEKTVELKRRLAGAGGASRGLLKNLSCSRFNPARAASRLRHGSGARQLHRRAEPLRACCGKVA